MTNQDLKDMANIIISQTAATYELEKYMNGSELALERFAKSCNGNYHLIHRLYTKSNLIANRIFKNMTIFRGNEGDEEFADNLYKKDFFDPTEDFGAIYNPLLVAIQYLAKHTIITPKLGFCFANPFKYSRYMHLHEKGHAFDFRVVGFDDDIQTEFSKVYTVLKDAGFIFRLGIHRNYLHLEIGHGYKVCHIENMHLKYCPNDSCYNEFIWKEKNTNPLLERTRQSQHKK